MISQKIINIVSPNFILISHLCRRQKKPFANPMRTPNTAIVGRSKLSRNRLPSGAPEEIKRDPILQNEIKLVPPFPAPLWIILDDGTTTSNFELPIGGARADGKSRGSIWRLGRHEDRVFDGDGSNKNVRSEGYRRWGRCGWRGGCCDVETMDGPLQAKLGKINLPKFFYP